jgi:hypothetical protein
VHFRGTKSFTVARPESRVRVDEEPPPEDDPDSAPKKTGLYDMRGPKDAIPEMQRGRHGDGTVSELDGSTITRLPTQPGTSRERLTIQQLNDLIEQLDRGAVELRITDATPWSSLVALATSVCSTPITITHSTE